jgi:predicted Zn-dependent peptidase
LPYEAIGTILGGTFTSRLNQNLREAKGYTYGAGSSFSFEPTLGTFAASSSVRADVTGASIKEFLLEINGIRKGDITPVETAKAVASLRTQIINRLATFGGLLGTAIEYGSFGRLFAGVNEDLAALNSITPGLLNGMVKDALPIESGVLVLVGDRAKILPQLEGLGLPKPEEVTFKP